MITVFGLRQAHEVILALADEVDGVGQVVGKVEATNIEMTNAEKT
jgi:hypothetical protein